MSHSLRVPYTSRISYRVLNLVFFSGKGRGRLFQILSLRKGANSKRVRLFEVDPVLNTPEGIRRDGREEGLQGKHYFLSSPIHMQLRAGIMLPSGLSELHSCKEKVHEASCCGHGKIILIFLIAEYVFKKFDVSVGERQSLKETLAKSIGQKCCDTRKVVKRGK